MSPWLTGLAFATAIGGLAYCFFYFVFPFWALGPTYDWEKLDVLQRRALSRAAGAFVISLALFGLRFQLTSLLGAWKEPESRARKAVQVWANTKSGFYYCAGSEFYGKLAPGKYLSESEAIQSGYQPSLRTTCR